MLLNKKKKKIAPNLPKLKLVEVHLKIPLIKLKEKFGNLLKNLYH